MHIIFLLGVFPPEGEPSAVMARQLVTHWARSGHHVDVICPFPNRPQGKLFPGFKRALWSCTVQEFRIIRVWSWFLNSRRTLLHRILENLTFGVSSSFALLVLPRPDVLVMESWPVGACLMTTLVARAKRIPILNYIKDIYPEAIEAAGILRPHSLPDRAIRYLDSVVCRLASINVVLSHSMEEIVLARNGVRNHQAVIIRDWIDLHELRPFEGTNGWRARNGIPPDAFVFMFAGTMGLQSKADLLSDVASLVKEEEKIAIVCVGEGVLKERLADEQRARGLTNLFLRGFQPREVVAEMQSSADVMLLLTGAQMGASSVPSKMITYLAVGKPVLCAAGPDSALAALVTRHAFGRVVSPENAAELAGAMKAMALLEAEALRQLGVMARRTAEELYSMERAFHDFDTLIETVVGHRLDGIHRAEELVVPSKAEVVVSDPATVEHERGRQSTMVNSRSTIETGVGFRADH